MLAGPTTDYGYTNFGSDVTTQGYVSENPVPTAKCGTDGTCTYTFTHADSGEGHRHVRHRHRRPPRDYPAAGHRRSK